MQVVSEGPAKITKATIDEVAEPKGFGGSGGKGTPLFWSIRFHVGEKKQELSLTPEGTIIRLPIPVEVILFHSRYQEIVQRQYIAVFVSRQQKLLWRMYQRRYLIVAWQFN